MGLNNEDAVRLIFDIETAPLLDAAEYLVEPIEAPANYKDPVKIAAYIEDKRAEQLQRCSLDADLCRVVAVSWWREDEPTPHVSLAEDEDEADLLAGFWKASKGLQMVGFNCLDFDLPVLLRRSLYLKVARPRLNLDRYRTDVIDLMQLLSFNGKLKPRGLAFYSKRFGFEIEDPINGAEDIAQAVEDGRWGDVRAHVLADVQKSALLAAELGYFHRIAAVSLPAQEQIA